MQRILVLNAKGGCGKTTLATNLAGYFSYSGEITALLDYDPQGSSMKWLSLRPDEQKPIEGIAAYQRRQGITRAFQMQLPRGITRVVIDAPSGITSFQLTEYLSSVDVVLLPVLPSPIDIHAAAHFVQDLLLVGKIRSRGIRLGIVANRVRKNTLVFKDLEQFLNTLGIPLVTTLRDSQNYIRAAEQGLALHELNSSRVDKDLAQWSRLVQWLQIPAVQPLPISHLATVSP